MPRAKFQTLTEQMFYILLCLSRECCGIDIMDQVPAMTGGRVRVGSGTLYNLLEQFVKAEMIRETQCLAAGGILAIGDPDSGPAGARSAAEALEEEYRRLCAQVTDYRRMFGEEESQ